MAAFGCAAAAAVYALTALVGLLLSLVHCALALALSPPPSLLPKLKLVRLRLRLKLGLLLLADCIKRRTDTPSIPRFCTHGHFSTHSGSANEQAAPTPATAQRFGCFCCCCCCFSSSYRLCVRVLARATGRKHSDQMVKQASKVRATAAPSRFSMRRFQSPPLTHSSHRVVSLPPNSDSLSPTNTRADALPRRKLPHTKSILSSPK